VVERKVFVFDPHLCTGCMYCMTACSTHNEGATSLSEARIRVLRHEGHALTRMEEEDELIFTVVTCRQCDNPVCAEPCPVQAITRDSVTGAMVIDQDLCTGCQECAMRCPYTAISVSKANNDQAHVFKCELCNGDPQCVKFCYPQALRYVPAREVFDLEKSVTEGENLEPPSRKTAFSVRGKKR
jgi:anaerobic carbon-monoxide dehydrogenase iron sulfur subunit